MSLESKLREEITKAVKKKDEVTRDVLRLVLGEIQQKSTDGNLNDAEIIKIVNTVLKSNRQTLELTTDPSAKDKLKQECDALEQFLPQAMTEEEIRSLVNKLKPELSKAPAIGARIGLVIKKHKELGMTKSLDARMLGAILKDM